MRDSAYWLVASDGGIFAFGGAPYDGSMGGKPLNKPIVGIAGTVTHGGYWEVASDGGIFAFGSAPFYGSTGGMPLNKPIVGMAPAPTGAGYWLVASDGGVFCFNATGHPEAAGFYGSTGDLVLNKPVVGMAPTPTGKGYWLVASDGGIFAFGAAQFYGSTGAMSLNAPIVGMAATADGKGYWLVASDGGIFAFGDAGTHFYGSLGGVPLSRPVVSMSSVFDGSGYWMTNNNGAVSNFGTATYWGSAPQVLVAPVVGIATAEGNGDPGSTTYQPGSYGYDVSNYQCGGFPPAPHAIGVVEVEGASFGAVNPCLAQEAQWAGGGLNLYLFLTFGTAASSGDPACATTADPAACNDGFNAAVDAYGHAAATIGNAAVPWWLDIEGETTFWSPTAAANDSLIQGAIDALSHAEGLNQVGIYTSPGVWPLIAGNYRPPVLWWAADWAKTPPATLCARLTTHASMDVPSGPLAMVQYSSPSYTFPSGGMDTVFDNDYAC